MCDDSTRVFSHQTCVYLRSLRGDACEAASSPVHTYRTGRWTGTGYHMLAQFHELQKPSDLFAEAPLRGGKREPFTQQLTVYLTDAIFLGDLSL